MEEVFQILNLKYMKTKRALIVKKSKIAMMETIGKT